MLTISNGYHYRNRCLIMVGNVGRFFGVSKQRHGIMVVNLPNNDLVKAVTLDYDFMGSDHLELYHAGNGTNYTFKGREYITYLKSGIPQTGKKKEGKSQMPL